MKKICALLLLGVCLIFIPACGNQAVSDYSGSTSGSVPTGEISDSKDVETPENITDVETEKQIDFEKLKETISIEFEEFEETALIDMENTTIKIKADAEKLKTDIDTYDKYLENFDMVKAFHEQVCEDTRNLYIRLYEYDLDLAERFAAHAEEMEELNAKEWEKLNAEKWWKDMKYGFVLPDRYGIEDEMRDMMFYYYNMGQDAYRNDDISSNEKRLFEFIYDNYHAAYAGAGSHVSYINRDFIKAHKSLWEKLIDSVNKHNMEAVERVISDFRESIEEL